MSIKVHHFVQRLMVMSNQCSYLLQGFLIEFLAFIQLSNLNIYHSGSRSQRLNVRTKLHFHSTTPPFIVEVIYKQVTWTARSPGIFLQKLLSYCTLHYNTFYVNRQPVPSLKLICTHILYSFISKAEKDGFIRPSLLSD